MKGPDAPLASAMAAVKIMPSSGNVFVDLGFGDEEAERLRIRSSLLIAIRKGDRGGLTQADAAKLFGVSDLESTAFGVNRIFWGIAARC